MYVDEYMFTYKGNTTLRTIVDGDVKKENDFLTKVCDWRHKVR